VIFFTCLGNNNTGIIHKNAVMVASLNPSKEVEPDKLISNWVILVRDQNSKNDNNDDFLIDGI
jgi:hypothetical protein